MPVAGKKVQAAKGIEKEFGPGVLQDQSFSFGSANLSLDGLFVKTSEDRIRVRRRIELVMPIHFVRLE